MGSVHRRRAEQHEVGLEVHVVNGEVVANIRPPNRHSPTCEVESVPLVDAAAIAARLAERFGVDIAVVDLDTTDNEKPAAPERDGLGWGGEIQE